MPQPIDEAVDLVIVGSGPAGSSYARAVLEEVPEAAVLVLEAGPIATKPAGLHMANIADPDVRAAAQVRFQGPNQRPYARLSHERVARADHAVLNSALRERPGLWAVDDADGEFPAAQASTGVGGMGAHWFGACPRPWGSERIPFIEESMLDAAYERAEQLLQVANDQFSDHVMAERIRAGLSAVVDADRDPARTVQQMPMALRMTQNGVHRTAPDTLLAPMLDGAAPEFELRSGALATRVLHHGGVVVGVEYVDLQTRDVKRIAAAHVVVAADSVHTAQLLWASGIRPLALGRRLNEHPQISLIAVLEDGSGRPEIDRTSGRGDTGVMSDPSAMAIASSGVQWIPFAGEGFPFHVQVTHVDPATVGLRHSEVRGLGPLISLAFFLPQEVRWENRVAFADGATDWRGLPRPRFHYARSDGDRHLIERAVETAVAVADGLGKPLRDERPRELPAGSSLHYQGTLSMGQSDDGASVCDRSSQVWGVEGLRVAGNGVIPTSTACNPTLTSVALAVLGAREIAADLTRTTVAVA